MAGPTIGRKGRMGRLRSSEEEEILELLVKLYLERMALDLDDDDLLIKKQVKELKHRLHEMGCAESKIPLKLQKRLKQILTTTKKHAK